MTDDELETRLRAMLDRRADRVPTGTDPVGATRRHITRATSRRRRAVAATAVAVIAVGGLTAFRVTGSAARGSAARVAPGADAGDYTGTPHWSCQAPANLDTRPASNDAFTAVSQITWPVRGSLAGDASFVEAVRERAAAVSGSTGAVKVLYAGDDGFARIAVVAVPGSVPSTLDAVVLYGPSGLATDQLGAQIPVFGAGPNVPFSWATPVTGGTTIGVMLGSPEVSYVGYADPVTPATGPDPGTMNGPTPNVPVRYCSTADGTMQLSLPAGKPAPIEFSGPFTGTAGNMTSAVRIGLSAVPQASGTTAVPPVWSGLAADVPEHDTNGVLPGSTRATPAEATLLRNLAAYVGVPVRDLRDVFASDVPGRKGFTALSATLPGGGRWTMQPQDPAAGQGQPAFWSASDSDFVTCC